MERKKRSIIWTTPLDEFELIVKESNTITEILNKFGFHNKGSNYKTLMNRINYENIDINHIISSKNIQPKTNLYDVLVENSSFKNNYNLKKRLIKEKLISEVCRDCGLEKTWNNKPISLQLEHINGNSRDNRIENLCLLCPNCHSQTETFAGKSLKGTSNRIKNYCVNCSKELHRTTKGKQCLNCINKNKRKVERPSKEELKKLLENNTFVAVGKMFGVSDNAIRKWLR